MAAVSSLVGLNPLTALAPPCGREDVLGPDPFNVRESILPYTPALSGPIHPREYRGVFRQLDRADPAFTGACLDTSPHETVLTEVPSLLHLIWLGEKPLTKAFKANAVEWRGELDDGVIWTEKRDPPEGLKEFAREGDFRLVYIGDVIGSSSPISPYLSHYLRGLFVNYGAASDILRNELLNLFGGVYVDFDVTLRPEYREMLNFAEQAGTFSAPTRGNDIQMSCPGHPIHGLIREEIKTRVGRDLGKSAWDPFHTVAATGPSALQAALIGWKGGEGYEIRQLLASGNSAGSWFIRVEPRECDEKVTQLVVTQCLVEMRRSRVPDWGHIPTFCGDAASRVTETALRYIGAHYPEDLARVQGIRRYKGPDSHDDVMMLDSIPRAVACLSLENPPLSAVPTLASGPWYDKQYEDVDRDFSAINQLYRLMDSQTQKLWRQRDPTIDFYQNPARINTNQLMVQLWNNQKGGARLGPLEKWFINVWDDHFRSLTGAVVHAVMRRGGVGGPREAIAKYNRLAGEHSFAAIDLSSPDVDQIEKPLLLFSLFAPLEKECGFEKAKQQMKSYFCMKVIASLIVLGAAVSVATYWVTSYSHPDWED